MNRVCAISSKEYDKFISPPDCFLILGRVIHRAQAGNVLELVKNGSIPIGWLENANGKPMTVDDLAILAYK